MAEETHALPEESSPPTIGADTPFAPPGSGASPTATPPSGYELLGELGRGGMGVVYKARQVSLGRVVALKMLRSAEFAYEEDIRRFLVEAQAVARLRHPGIVQVFDFGRFGDLPYFTMEYLEGGSLHELASKGPLSPPEAAGLLVAIARAVQHAHDNGVLHRDLKPENVLLMRDGQPRVADFGLARLSEDGGERTRSGAVMGTPGYMPPEQATGQNRLVGPASDVYSLGAILYRLLVGHPPFHAATPYETMLKVIAEEPPPPRRLNLAVPRDLETIALKCLRKEPAGRYRSAGELADDLQRFLDDEPILARPTSASERLTKWVRRNRTVAVLAALAAVALVAGSVASTLFAIDAHHSAAREAERAREQRLAREDADEQRRRAEGELERAEQLIYAGQLAAARREWQSGNAEAAWQQLDSTRWDLRGWEYRHLYSLFTRHHVRLGGHAGRGTAVAVSPDGGLVASAGEDDVIQLRDARTGALLQTLGGHKERIDTVAFSPDGASLASGGLDGLVQVFDTKSGKARFAVGQRFSVGGVAFSPDGTLVAAACLNGVVRLYDAIKGDERGVLDPQEKAAELTCLAFSPDGRRLVASGKSGGVHVWDFATRKHLHSFAGHSPTTCVAYSPDGRRIVSGGGDGVLRVRDAATRQVLLSLEGHTGGVTGAAYRPDGRALVSCGVDRTLIVWDAASGRSRTLHGHRDAVRGVAFAPDGRRIVSVGRDRAVFVWDAHIQDGDRPPDDGQVTALAFSPDASLVATARGRVIQVRPVGGPARELRGHTGDVTCLAFSTDGGGLVSGGDDQTVRIWHLSTDKEHVQGKHADAVGAVAFSHDGTRVLSGGHDNALILWDTHNGAMLRTFGGHESPVLAVAFAPSGNHLASGDKDGGVRVWEVGGGSMALAGHADEVNSVAFSPDGQSLLSASDDGLVRVWDRGTGRSLATLKGHTEGVLSAAFFPDGGRIVSGSEDKTVRVWDARSGVGLLTLEGRDWFKGVAVGGDGRRVVGGDDSGVRVWDAESVPDSLPLRGSRRAGVSAATVRGDRVLARDIDDRLLVWDVRTGQLLTRTSEPFPQGEAKRQLPDGRVLALEGDELSVVTAERPAELVRRRERLAQWARPDPAWHLEEAAHANGFALVWHLDRLPADAGGLRQRAQLLAASADPAATVALARQACWDTSCGCDRRRALPALTALLRGGDATAAQALAGLQLRAGAAEAALETLQGKGGKSAELLRALAYRKLGKDEQARRHLEAAQALAVHDAFSKAEADALLAECQR